MVGTEKENEGGKRERGRKKQKGKTKQRSPMGKSPIRGLNPDPSDRQLLIPYFLDYSAPLFSSRPRIDRALCPGLRVILRALK